MSGQVNRLEDGLRAQWQDASSTVREMNVDDALVAHCAVLNVKGDAMMHAVQSGKEGMLVWAKEKFGDSVLRVHVSDAVSGEVGALPGRGHMMHVQFASDASLASALEVCDVPENGQCCLMRCGMLSSGRWNAACGLSRDKFPGLVTITVKDKREEGGNVHTLIAYVRAQIAGVCERDVRIDHVEMFHRAVPVHMRVIKVWLRDMSALQLLSEKDDKLKLWGQECTVEYPNAALSATKQCILCNKRGHREDGCTDPNRSYVMRFVFRMEVAAGLEQKVRGLLNGMSDNVYTGLDSHKQTANSAMLHVVFGTEQKAKEGLAAMACLRQYLHTDVLLQPKLCNPLLAAKECGYCGMNDHRRVKCPLLMIGAHTGVAYVAQKRNVWSNRSRQVQLQGSTYAAAVGGVISAVAVSADAALMRSGLCFQFHRFGRCHFGTNCRFKHSSVDRENAQVPVQAVQNAVDVVAALPSMENTEDNSESDDSTATEEEKGKDAEANDTDHDDTVHADRAQTLPVTVGTITVPLFNQFETLEQNAAEAALNDSAGRSTRNRHSSNDKTVTQTAGGKRGGGTQHTQ